MVELTVGFMNWLPLLHDVISLISRLYEICLRRDLELVLADRGEPQNRDGLQYASSSASPVSSR
jgi:hypothetical protein